MQLLSARSRHSSSTLWLPALLIAVAHLLPQTLALPPSLGRRLSTISPEVNFVDLHITDAFGAPTFASSSSFFSSPNPPAARKHPPDEHMSSSPGGWPWRHAQSPSAAPASLAATLQAALDRLVVGARDGLGLPAPLAFLVAFGGGFLFVLGGLFSVFLLWEMARGLVGGWSGTGRGGGRAQGREFVIRSRVVLTPAPMRGILSPVGSRRSSSAEDEASPCPKRVRWVDEESGYAVFTEGCRMGGERGVDVGFDVEMEKIG